MGEAHGKVNHPKAHPQYFCRRQKYWGWCYKVMSPVKFNNNLMNSNHMRIFAENMKEMNTFFAQIERIAHHHHDVNIS